MTLHFYRCVRQIQFALALLGLLGCAGSAAQACNVPVFRFALERWRPDPYRLMLLHEGALTASQQSHLAPLRAHEEKSSANLALRQLDLRDVPSQKQEELRAVGKVDASPGLVVHYPQHLQIPTAVWQGAVSEETVARLLDSPVRKELVKRLVDGHSAVWLFLESGDPAKDDPAAELVQKEIEKLEQDLKLPELTESPDDALLTATPLRLAFSMIRIARDDPAEQMLVQMLVHCESDLLERSDPLVFPIFGRGRALFPLVGPGITKENILDSASFLVGPCSCQVKELNPGFDLLLAANWESLLALEGVALTAIANTEQTAPSGEVELVPIPSGSAGTASTSSNAKGEPTMASDHVAAATGTSPRLNMLGTTFVSLLVGVGVIAALLLARKR